MNYVMNAVGRASNILKLTQIMYYIKWCQVAVALQKTYFSDERSVDRNQIAKLVLKHCIKLLFGQSADLPKLFPARLLKLPLPATPYLISLLKRGNFPVEICFNSVNSVGSLLSID